MRDMTNAELLDLWYELLERGRELRQKQQDVVREQRLCPFVEFVEEVAMGPYEDSDIESLYQTMVERARAILAIGTTAACHDCANRYTID